MPARNWPEKRDLGVVAGPTPIRVLRLRHAQCCVNATARSVFGLVVRGGNAEPIHQAIEARAVNDENTGGFGHVPATVSQH